jgi:predicted transcriptional regulator of viral defense system
MRYLDFKHHFQDFLVISLTDIRLVEPDFDVRRLVEWQKKNYILQLKRGFYILAEATHNLTEEALFYIANKIYGPSYVSLESALHYYNFIPETAFAVTSISGRKTQHISNQIADFSYRSIKPEFMFGYQLIEIPSQKTGQTWSQQAKIAVPEKALLDFLYYQQNFKSQVDVSLLRLNREEIKQQVDLKQLQEQAAQFESQALFKRAQLLLNWLRAD